MNKIDLRMMYKADTGFWPTHFPGNYWIYGWDELDYMYVKWLEDFFPSKTDLHLKHKSEFPYLEYKEWLEKNILDHFEQVKSIIQSS